MADFHLRRTGAGAAVLLRLFSSSITPHRDPKVAFLYDELDSLRPLSPAATRSAQARDRGEGGVQERQQTEDVSHPWPEWMALMKRLLGTGYLDPMALPKSSASSAPPPSNSWTSSSKESNGIRTACLNFARDMPDIIRYLSRRDIYVVAQCGCPTLDRKVVNSGKRLRAFVGIEEGDVCSSCGMRGNCERAYIKAREDEVGRTVDVMRLLLTYGLDVFSGGEDNKACLNISAKEAVRRLLKDMVKLSSMELDCHTSGAPLSRPGISSGQQIQKAKMSVPLKQGDWTCPKCNFLNFAKNLRCLRCYGESHERIKKFREEQEHLPLRKGDWICHKCNVLNFAKNTKCFQCNEKPQNRQLSQGEWECISCNYLNFRRNAICLKCGWKRPKASASGNFIYGSVMANGGGSPTFLRNSFNIISQQFLPRKSPEPQREENFMRFRDLAYSDGRSSRSSCVDDSDTPQNTTVIDDFPIVGGRSVISRDPVAKERWKSEMNTSCKGFVHRSKESSSSCRSPGLPQIVKTGSTTSDDDDDSDDIAGWFRCRR